MGYFSQILAEPAAQQAGRLTLDELLQRNVIGSQVWGPLGQKLGVSDWQMNGGGMDEAGNLIGTGVADPSKLASLRDYTFGWQNTGPANTGTLTVFDKAGAQVGSYDQTDQSAGDAFGEWAALAAAGFGGAGLLGLGPLGGVLGGLTGASTAGSTGAVTGIAAPGAGELAAYGASLTPAEVMASATGLELGGTGLGAAGTAGAGIAGSGLSAGGTYGTITANSTALGAGGAGLSSGAGLTAPAFAGGGSGLVGGLGMTAAAGAGAGSAGGLSGILGGLAGYLPAATSLASLASGVYGMKLAGDAREASDPFGPYRAGYAQKLAALEANPGLITTRPGFQAGLETIGRKSAGSGYYGSGNMASALSRYSGDFYTQEANRLAGLAGAGQTPGAGQFQAADLAGQALGSIGYGIGPLLQRLTQGG